MKSLQQLKEERDSIDIKIRQLENISSFGIPKTNVHKFIKPCVDSGHSMGEVTKLYCNGEIVCMYDRTTEYAKSCKWKAKHGLVVIECNKKELKQYFDMCIMYDKIDYRIRHHDTLYSNLENKDELLKKHFSEEYELQKELNKWMKDHINTDISIIKKLSI